MQNLRKLKKNNNDFNLKEDNLINNSINNNDTSPNILKPNFIKTKIKMKRFNNNSFIKINNENENLNNVTNNNNNNNINNNNNNNINNNNNNNNNLIESFGSSFNIINSKINWKDILNEFSITLPSICYKMKYQCDLINNNNTNNSFKKIKLNNNSINNNYNNNNIIYKYLNSSYFISKYDSLRDWKLNMKSILNNIPSLNNEIEHCLIFIEFFDFIHNFFLENDENFYKKNIENIKNLLFNNNNNENEKENENNFDINMNELSMINLIEGLLEKNYLKSEFFFSKVVFLILLEYGDPRGRFNDSHGFMQFALWKISRKTCLLEKNIIINEYLKEMFHSLDYFQKIFWNNNNNNDNFIVNKIEGNLNINIEKNFEKIINLFNNNVNNNNNNNCYLTTESILLSIENNIDEKNEYENYIDRKYTLSECNFNYNNCEINITKNFNFPSISEKKNNLNKIFFHKEYLIYFLKIFQNLFLNTSKNYSKFYLDNNISNELIQNIQKNQNNNFNKTVNNNNITTTNNNENLNYKMKTQTNPSKQNNNNNNNNNLFSHFIYNELLEKLNFHKNLPTGILFSFGNNSHNETCHDNYNYLTLPRLIFKLKNKIIKKIYCGWEHNIIIDNKNEIYAWGNNISNQCGKEIKNKIDEICKEPINLSLINNGITAKMASCGNEHNLILTFNGEVYGFGHNDDGVLGFKEDVKIYKFKKITFSENNNNNLLDSNHNSNNNNNIKIISISSGTVHNMALSSDGSVYSWGSAQGGQLGLSEIYLTSNHRDKFYISSPTKIPTLPNNISKISCGEAHSLALTNQGMVYSWGFGSNGQLGLGFCEDSFEPGKGMVKSRIFEPELIYHIDDISDIILGKTFSMFINKKRELYACGVNDLYQLGIEEKPNKNHLYSKDLNCFDFVLPTRIEHFLNMKVMKVSCGEGHCLALVCINENLLSEKILWSWGNNKFGQLGLGNQIKISLPKPINMLLEISKNYNIEEISCGGFHSICLVNNKYDVSWIENDFLEIEKIIKNFDL